MTSVVRSVADTDDEIITGILRLHNHGFPFDADVCFSRGSFYKSGVVPLPRLRFDIAPQDLDTERACATKLPLRSLSLDSIVFDPPFMFNPHGSALTKNQAAGRFTMFPTWADLERVYKGALNEFYRVLRPGGIVAFKCQDYTDSRTVLTHCLVWDWARTRGFYAKDFFVRYRLNGPAYNPSLNQRHARKYHSYWFVLEKEKGL